MMTFPQWKNIPGCPHGQGSQMKVRESKGSSVFFIESQGKSVKFLTSTCFLFQECKIQHYKICPVRNQAKYVS